MLSCLMVLTILISTQIAISIMVTRQIVLLQKRAGYLQVDVILDSLLLSPGDPPDWGRRWSGKPRILGLADSKTERLYVLDPYKVSRLRNDTINRITPTEARKLMGLREDYHFTLKIYPVFQVKITGNQSFIVTVKTRFGRPIINANVTAYYIPRSFSYSANYLVRSNITGLNGQCSLEFEERENYVLLVKVEIFGLKVERTFPEGLNLKVIGGHIIKTDYSLINEICFSTGVITGMGGEHTSRLVEIDGSIYVAEFYLWR